jgi:hypothetical protein
MLRDDAADTARSLNVSNPENPSSKLRTEAGSGWNAISQMDASSVSSASVLETLPSTHRSKSSSVRKVPTQTETIFGAGYVTFMREVA